ncbi:efflux RND transporter periplasmic adaptor subunit [Flavicella sp.]|uniref:efflux RND transporter periplasmic adaptor subunit n=1 Tax=Flavicella sp. TaxID=2957742 RepID=UPI0030168E34
MNKILKNIWIILAVGLITGIVIGDFLGGTSTDKEHASHQHDNEEESQIWTCSMHPQIQKDKPGQCPLCGMDLIPLDNSMDNENNLPDEVPMSASAMKLAEIQTYIVKKGKPVKEIRLFGKVKVDERLMYSQAIHFSGRIEKLYINFTGEKVKKGQKIASVYSAELVTAQKELFEVLKDELTNPTLVKAARNKLKQWKFTNIQIAALEKSGKIQTEVDILSDYSGYVIMRMVSEGDYFNEGQILFKITDLSKVWVLFEAYENDLPWIKVGDQFEIELKSLPGQTFTEKVTFIDPFINPKTRVAYVRVELANSKGKLKPNMFANGIVTTRLSIDQDVILAPKTAVLWTGKRSIVYVKIPNRKHNSFIYREVILGSEAGDFYIIKKGLKEGEQIASNGVFKIDASAQLAGKKSMMNPTGKKVTTSHNHVGSKQNQKKMNMNPIVIVDKTKIPFEFKKQLGNVVNAYLALKNKLSNDNSTIKIEVRAVQKSLTKVDMTLVIENDHNEWMKTSKSLNNDLKKLLKEVNIHKQRNIFLTISKSLSNIIMKLGVKMDENKTLYLKFCPMTNNNSGGYWLSIEKEIQNPYYGQSMLKCGEIKQEIK